jgi:23S rRNA pseudouridine1911/1915/1917 synthase
LLSRKGFPVNPLTTQSFSISAAENGQTLAAFLRSQLSDTSWTNIKRLVLTRRARIDGDLCLDPARRLREGQTVELSAEPAQPPRRHDALIIRHIDSHIVVVEKPSGISTVRHPSERAWSARRKALHPTLVDLVPPLLAAREARHRKGTLPRLRIVQRLDKETSGLVVFARTPTAEIGLGRQFRVHTVTRRYLAVVRGVVQSMRIVSNLVRDRGDGRRGSTATTGLGKEAVTHVELIERLGDYSLLSCRLETGRTHQIRIHLAEMSHFICGEKVYNRRLGFEPTPDHSGAPRLALHAAELGFKHPVTNADMHWDMPLPADLGGWVDQLRKAANAD